MAHDPDLAHAALHWCGKALTDLSDRERLMVTRLAGKKPHTRDPNASFDETLTFGQRLADKVAEFGGSWTFIIAFGVALVLWTGTNLILARRGFDPYPFIFLNLLLSMLAALQAPVIMMSQNRQSKKDRSDAAHDYAVNLKAEVEIMALHDKLDQIRVEQMEEMLRRQQAQFELLTELVRKERV